MSISIEEQETVVQFGRSDDLAIIYTSDTTVMTKLDKRYKRKKEHLCERAVVAVEYEVPKNLISFRSEVNRSEEYRKKKSEMMKRLHEAGKLSS